MEELVADKGDFRDLHEELIILLIGRMRHLRILGYTMRIFRDDNGIRWPRWSYLLGCAGCTGLMALGSYAHAHKDRPCRFHGGNKRRRQ